MRKVIIALLASCLCFCSCRRNYEYETTIVYKIYYTTGNVTERTYTFDSTDDPGYVLASDRGSNYLHVQAKRDGWFTWGVKLEDTSAPIEVVSFTKRKKQ